MDETKTLIDDQLQAMKRLRARDKSDNDTLHSSHITELKNHLELLTGHGNHFESLAAITTMLIENLNM